MNAWEIYIYMTGCARDKLNINRHFPQKTFLRAIAKKKPSGVPNVPGTINYTCALPSMISQSVCCSGERF